MTRLLPWGVGVLILLSLYQGWRNDRNIARLATLVATDQQLRREADSLRPIVAESAAKLDTAYIARWRVLRDTLRLTDTVRVREALAVADTAIRACRAVLSDCQRLAKVEEARADSMTTQRDIWRGMARPLLVVTGEASYDPTGGGVYAAGEASIRMPAEWRAFGRVEQRLDSAATALRVGVRRPIRLF